MKFSLNPNYILASNLFLFSAGLGIVNVLLLPDVFNSSYTIFIGVVSIAFLILLALLIRIGIDWIKYILATLIIAGLFISYELMISEFLLRPLNGTINLIQSLAQICAVILLFLKKPIRQD